MIVNEYRVAFFTHSDIMQEWMNEQAREGFHNAEVSIGGGDYRKLVVVTMSKAAEG